jgi:hypothetical protein
MTVLYNVVGTATVYKRVKPATVYKIKKIDYIALQCKYLIIKYIYTEHRIDNKGDTVVDWTVVESAHRRDYVG